MRLALELASRGLGSVEPNPMVGCVVVADGRMIGEGYHERFGGPHAEVNALRHLQPDQLETATVYVTLEPCAHFGKTPPCTELLCIKKPRRIVIGMEDPYPAVAGRGIARLRAAGIDTEVGLLADEAKKLNLPYLKRVATGRPWVIAKWAMSLDGKIATRTGDSRWISNEASRAKVHRIRGRVDAIMVGIETALRDDPLLTARPVGLRVAKRVVLDHQARLPATSKLVKTIGQAPVAVFCDRDASSSAQHQLRKFGCEVSHFDSEHSAEQIRQVLQSLGQEGATNVLVEGGQEILGAFMDAGEIDEVHVFIAPMIVGGRDAKFPIGGRGFATIIESLKLEDHCIEQLGDNIYLHGHVLR